MKLPGADLHRHTSNSIPEYDVLFCRVSYDVLLEVFLRVDATQWERRAQQFETARPRRDDFPGRATAAETADRWHRLTEAAAACRARAAFVDSSKLRFGETLTDIGRGAM